jgi:4-hydroxythreonine-4-phosphate dehydrogenase
MSSKQIPTLRSARIKVGLTIGDPSGIGPAITLKAVRALKRAAEFVVIGDANVLQKSRPYDLRANAYELIDLNNVRPKNFSFGRISAEYGRASIEYLDTAMELLKAGSIDCLVTAPISKEAIQLAGYHYSGHTEYLAQASKTRDIVMMLFNDSLRFALVTRHVPLEKVSKNITKDSLRKTILITHRSLKHFFDIKNPRIVICGLNPHASDNGVIGNEENAVIKPVARSLKKKIKGLSGPVSADVAVYKVMKKECDCAIAMYHDQALIPLKLSGFERGVNMTLNLPFVRTSPLHGTAFDIAKRPEQADPSSLIAAIQAAIKCTRHQKKV